MAIFKDFLILDDTSEFLKRYYIRSEISIRLHKIFSFYNSFSKIFPNYTKVKESKYLYKNIQRKQKMIDNLNKGNKSISKKEKILNEKVFNSKIYKSILNQTNQSNNFNIDLKENESPHILETNISFENLIRRIQEAEKKSTIDIESSSSLEKPSSQLIKNKLNSVNANDKSKIVISKEKIRLNEFNNEKLITPIKEDMLKFEISRRLSVTNEKINLPYSKLYDTNIESSLNHFSTKSTKKLPKTELKESKNKKELIKEISLKTIQNKFHVPKIINNYNIINNVQNIIEAPRLIISGFNSNGYV